MQPVIFVPGLSDATFWATPLQAIWRKNGFDLHIHTVSWKQKEESFEEKLARLIQKIDVLSKNNTKISLIGTSAGGSFAMNAFALRKTKVHKLITISARLQKGNAIIPSLQLAAFGYPAFYQSVITCGENIDNFSKEDKEKMLTIQSLFFDEIVPLTTSRISGIQNMKIPIPFHTPSIIGALTFYRSKIISFLQT